MFRHRQPGGGQPPRRHGDRGLDRGLTVTAPEGPLGLALVSAASARPSTARRCRRLRAHPRTRPDPHRAGGKHRRLGLPRRGGPARRGAGPRATATHTRSGLGGLDGRGLRAGDRLGVSEARAGDGAPQRLLAPWLDRDPSRIRVVLGPQDDYFAEDQVAAFLAGPWTVSPRGDRMACFLDGTPLTHAKGHDIVSDGVAMGAIQVPGNGLPIILMADRQSTGGYPKIATVIGPDLGRLAQAQGAPASRSRRSPSRRPSRPPGRGGGPSRRGSARAAAAHGLPGGIPARAEPRRRCHRRAGRHREGRVSPRKRARDPFGSAPCVGKTAEP